MRLIEAVFNTPYKNIAFDEALLLKAEKHDAGEMIWFWQSEEYFVSLGRTSSYTEETHAEICMSAGIDIIRRLSGGASVLQGPGCFNFSVVLNKERNSSLSSVKSSYEYILHKIAGCMRKAGVELDKSGLSDLSLRGRKISGNAQIRKRRYVLHHGTLLYGLPGELVSRYLAHPPREPSYRKRRSHEDFLGNLSADPSKMKKVLLEAFDADKESSGLTGDDIKLVDDLVKDRYLLDEWNYRF